MQRQMMKEGDEQIGRQKLAEGAELDTYHENKNKERISRQDEIKILGLQVGGEARGEVLVSRTFRYDIRT